MANNVATDRIRRGLLLDRLGTQIDAAYRAGPQFIGGAAGFWSFWVKVTLATATSVTLKLESTYAEDDGVPKGWSTVGTRRNDVSPTVENGEHTFAADGVFLLTCERAARATDKTIADAFGNVGGLRFSHKGVSVASGTRVEIWGAAW